MHAAAILAGGRASRFGGRDKGALLVDGRPILDRQIAELAAVVGLDRVLVVGVAPRAGVRVVDDLVPGLGPLGGIHTALTLATEPKDAAADAVFVAACDMPFVTAPLVA